MNYEHLALITGVVTSISIQPTDCCSQLVSMNIDGQPVNLFVSSDTFVVDSTRLVPGMRIAAFYDSEAPVPLIYPPQYRALLVAPLRPEENAALNYFDDSLTASDNSLKLNLNPRAPISTLNGQAYFCSPSRRYLLVYYGATTKSIPPQTTPNRIIVLC